MGNVPTIEFSGPGLVSGAEALLEFVAKDPSKFYVYLGTLEAEHKRLSEATDALTSRNEELLGIIERANLNFVETRAEHDKEFTDVLVKRIAQLNDENRDLKNNQEINRLLKIQNKMLQDEREYRTKAVLNQAENIDKDYTRLAGVLHEYGVNAARLRNERDILEHNLEVTRKAGEIEISILKMEFNAKIAQLNDAYDKLGAEIRTEISNLQQGKDNNVRSHECIHTREGSHSTNWDSTYGSQPSSPDDIDECSDVLLEDRLWQQQVAIAILQKENTRMQNELNATLHVFANLEHSEASNQRLRSEALALAADFRQASADALNTFNTHFEKAMSTSWNNFGKLQLTMENQLHDNIDPDTAARIASFSERVCIFGQRPLSRMEQDIRDLVESTCEHFRDVQERIDALGNREDSRTDLELSGKCNEKKLEKDDHSPSYLKSLIAPDQETLVNDNTDTETSTIGRLLDCYGDTASESCKSDNTFTKESARIARISANPEDIYNEAVQAELTWRTEAFPIPQNSVPQSGCSSNMILPTQRAYSTSRK